MNRGIVTPAEAEEMLAEWAAADRSRDDLIRTAIEAGVSKHRIHVLTGVARTTIDRVAARRAQQRAG